MRNLQTYGIGSDARYARGPTTSAPVNYYLRSEPYPSHPPRINYDSTSNSSSNNFRDMTRQELNESQRFVAGQTVNQTFNEAMRHYRSEMGSLKDRIRKIQTMIDDPSQKDAVAGLIKDLMHQSGCLLYTAVEPDPVDTDRIMDDAFATISSDFDPTFSPMADAGIHALALLNDAVYSSSVITAEEAAAFLSQCTE